MYGNGMGMNGMGMNGMGMNGMGMNGMGMNGMGMNGMLMNGMNNPMNMMNMIQMYNMLNMMNQNNNNNNQNMNSGMNNQNNSGTNMPRNATINCNPYQNYSGLKSNVTFESSAGFKMNMPVPYSIKLKDLFKTFVQRAGLHESVLGKNINFIFNALYVNPFEEKTLSEFGFTNFAKILVLDVSNLLGGKLYKN